MIRKGVLVCCAATALLFGSPAYAVNLVANGDFEANLLDGTITDWLVAGDGVADDLVFPNTGLHDVVFTSLIGDPNPGVLSQDVATTAGQDYRLSFWLMNEGVGLQDFFTVSFGGFTKLIHGLDVSAAAGGGYTQLTYDIEGALVTGPLTTLSFSAVADPTFGAPFNLDDISLQVLAIPEPSQWALMIAGFGLAGAALRRRRDLRAQA